MRNINLEALRGVIFEGRNTVSETIHIPSELLTGFIRSEPLQIEQLDLGRLLGDPPDEDEDCEGEDCYDDDENEDDYDGDGVNEDT